METQIRHDGEYPFDQFWSCKEGHSHPVWEKVAVISEAAGKALLGMKDEQWFTSKGYVVYHTEFDTGSLAVHRRSNDYYIIRTNVSSIMDEFEDRRVGTPIPGINSGGAVGATIVHTMMPFGTEIRTDQCCPW
jgi:hypothetical protein